jgi:hypothetical protein
MNKTIDAFQRLHRIVEVVEIPEMTKSFIELNCSNIRKNAGNFQNSNQGRDFF